MAGGVVPTEYEEQVMSTRKSYIGAKYRCENNTTPAYENVEFKFESYQDFLEEVGLKPSKEHSIDRIDSDKHYEPGNIRWATRTEQNRNRKPMKNKNGFPGVHKRSGRKNKWVATIYHNGKSIYLGTFNNPEDAYKSYELAKLKKHGVVL